MVSTLHEQFLRIVERASTSANAYLCEGDSDSAVVWDGETEITVRLALRGDEAWLLAGSGLFVRFVADSEGHFDLDGVAETIESILAGEAIEYFGVRGRDIEENFATGFSVGGGRDVAGGRGSEESLYSARLAGPMARAAL